MSAYWAIKPSVKISPPTSLSFTKDRSIVRETSPRVGTTLGKNNCATLRRGDKELYTESTQWLHADSSALTAMLTLCPDTPCLDDDGVGTAIMHVEAMSVNSAVVEDVRNRNILMSLLFISAATVDTYSIVNGDG